MQSKNLQSAKESDVKELLPQELSGDENDEQNMMMSSLISSQKKANFLLTVTTIVKSTIGAGIISLPYAISRLGYVFALMVFAMFGVLNQICCSLLLRSKNLAKHSNYSTIMGYIWGSDLSNFLGSLIIFLDNFGVCVLHLILLKGSIRKLIKDVSQDDALLEQFYCSQIFIILILFSFLLPFVLQKKIEKLKFLALFGVIGVSFFVICIIIHFFLKRGQGFYGQPMNAFPQNWFQAISVMPNIIFAFQYQTNFFSIFKGMKNSTDKRMTNASIVGILCCGSFYLLIGMVGYSLSGQNIDPNFLQSLPYETTNEIIFFTINITFLSSIICAYPFAFFAARNNLISIGNLITKQIKKKEVDQTQSKAQITEEFAIEGQGEERKLKKQKKNRLFYIYTISNHLIIGIIAVYLNNIQDILNLVGAICQNLIAIILPCLFYFMLIRKQQKQRTFFYYFTIVMVAIVSPYAIFSIVANYE